MASTDHEPVEAMSDRVDLNPVLTTASSGVTIDGEFRSVLSSAGDVAASDAREPACFRDLNLDQAVEAIVSGRDEYDLKPFFYTPLHDVETVEYRHEVFRDLEREEVRRAVRTFAEAMRRVRNFLTLAQKQHYKYEKERWFLDAATVYRDAISTLVDELTNLQLSSTGLRALRDYLAHHRTAEQFISLTVEIDRVRAGLDAVTYTVRIKGGRVTVSGYRGERDYTAEVEETFARFRQGDVEDHLAKIPDPGSMDHVEARIAQLVARLYPKEFGALDEFCVRQRDFLDPRIARFDREVQFYLAYIEYSERLKASELLFSYPIVSDRSQESSVEDAFDVALAAKLASESATLVRNDFFLCGPERILVVTGPNQGGKTTFARMFGQLHYLASLGVPVPARNARLFLPDQVFTHFEVEEDIATLRGKLDDELVRIRDILGQATGYSIVILNEIFASTTLADAVYLGTDVLKRLIELGCLAVCVTFVDELSALGEATVSMVATVAPDDPSTRTFRIVRRPADGRAYAWALADKYGLSYERLKKRISP
jgi:DNA mismatch repair protein MutS